MPRFALTLPVVFALAACNWTVDLRDEAAPEPDAPSGERIEVEGSAFYPERVALPASAHLTVQVYAITDHGRVHAAGLSRALDGQQVPIPLRFGFEVPPATRALVLDLAVRDGARVLRSSEPVLLDPRAGRAEAGRVRLLSPNQVAFGQAWRCGPHELVFGRLGGEQKLRIDGGLQGLEQVPADSGLRFRSRQQPDLSVHRSGDGLMLQIAERTIGDCRRLEAIAPPTRALGQEPGWHLELEAERMVLQADYGQSTYRVPLLETRVVGRSTRFIAADAFGAMLASFTRGVCRDSATGQPHPYTVRVQTTEHDLTGCGGQPIELLTGSTWRVRAIDSRRLSDGADITLHFDSDGMLSGKAACNRYRARFEVTGEGLRIEPAAATKMACADPLMEAEQHFFHRLAGVRRFDLDDGELTLIADLGEIVAH